jgi:membrane-bound lytic murein transglycosylase D
MESEPGSALVRSAADVPVAVDPPPATAMVDREISLERKLPEEEFPEIDVDSVPAAGYHTLRHAERQAAMEADLWRRLGAGFRLGNLEDTPDRVEKFERWYAKHPKYFDRLSERAYWFLYYVLEQVEARGMPAEIAILPAIESAFRPDATSRSRAAGMWQFIGATGRRYGLRQDWWMDARRDLVQSTRAALDYLDFLSQEFSGDWELALAAYNAGEGTIRRQLQRNKQKGLPGNYSRLKLRRETMEYLPRLLAVRNILRDPGKYGITLPPLENRPTLQVVDLKNQTDISVAATFTSLTRKQLHFLNLGYRRGVTPPNGPHHLVVPVDEAEALVTKLASLSPSQRMRWAHHRVRKGEYLGKIASLHGVSVESIRRANKLNSTLIKPGQELRIPLSGGAYEYAGPAGGSGNSQKHLVASGDSLWKISRIYGVTLADLLRWNQLSSGTTLYPGQSIVVRR